MNEYQKLLLSKNHNPGISAFAKAKVFKRFSKISPNRLRKGAKGFTTRDARDIIGPSYSGHKKIF